MPTVKSYKAQQGVAPLPNVQRTKLPIGQLQAPVITAQPSAQSMGAQLGETVRAVGEQGFQQELRYQDQLRQKAKQQQDRVAILEADRRLSEWENQTLYDPKQGVLNIRGKDAFGLPEAVSKGFEQTYGDLWQGLSNDDQRLAFDQLAQTRRRDVQGTVLRHVSKQLTDFEATEQASYLQNSREAAASNALDPVRVGTEIQRQRIAISSFADTNGLGPEWVKEQTDKTVSQTHVDVLNQMLALGQDLNAKTYFEHNKDDIQGTSLAALERNLREGSVRGESQRQTARILQSATTLEDARTEAKKIADPEVQDDVLGRIHAEFVLKQQRQREDQEAATAQAKQTIDQTVNQMENLIDTRKPVFARDVVPPAIWNNLPHNSREALETYARRYQDKPAGIETDLGTYRTLRLKAADDEQEFARLNLMEYVSKLSKGDFKEMVDLQANIRKGNRTEADKYLEGIRTNERIIDGALRQVGVDPLDKANKARVDQLWNMVDKQVLELQRNTGKKASNDDIQGIVDRQLIEIGAQPGSWWNIFPGGEPFFDQPGKRVFELGIQDVPAADRQQIERALRQSNRPATEDAILNLYIQTQQRLQQTKKKTGGP